MIAWIRLHVDAGRTVIIAIKRIRVEMTQQGGDEGFMIFWHTDLVGWITCRKQGVEETMEFASAYKTDIAYLHRPIWVPWTWPPHGMSIRRILNCKLFAKDVAVGHRDRKGQGKLSKPMGWWKVL
jgi:hypothetical protein